MMPSGMGKLEFELYSIMVGGNFEIFMSEMPKNVGNCQNQTPPSGRNLKIPILSHKSFSQGTMKSDFPPKRTVWKILISRQNFGKKGHYVRLEFNFQIRIFLFSVLLLDSLSKHWYSILNPYCCQLTKLHKGQKTPPKMYSTFIIRQVFYSFGA